jgi:hypothetical protein
VGCARRETSASGCHDEALAASKWAFRPDSIIASSLA